MLWRWSRDDFQQIVVYSERFLYVNVKYMVGDAKYFLLSGCPLIGQVWTSCSLHVTQPSENSQRG